MGNNNNKTYNTYISLVSNLYKKNKKIYRYIIHSNIRTKYINQYNNENENIKSPNVLLKGGSACPSPIDSKTNIFKIMIMENYINKENNGTPRSFLLRDISDITDIIIDSNIGDTEFIIII
jgi:hypothetical protein